MSGYQYRGPVTLDRDPLIARERQQAERRGEDAPAPGACHGGVLCRVCSGPVKSPGLPVCASHVTNELGITYRQLDHWSRMGYLQPSRQDHGKSRSSGSSRVWTPEELRIARLMGRLVHAGLTPQAAAKAARSGLPRQIAEGIWIEVTG